MSGELPPPPTTTHVVAPTMPTVRIEATPAPAPAKPTVEPIEDKPADVIWSPPVVIDSAEIEMAAEVRKPQARRAVSRAVARPQPLAIEKPAKKARIEKKSSNKEAALVATEIAAPKGAAVVTGSGRVTITSNRPAMIFLDGRATGKSAPAALVIPAGDHQITLLDPGTKKARTATVTIAAGKSIAIAKDFN
jgi:hypothetical protein